MLPATKELRYCKTLGMGPQARPGPDWVAIRQETLVIVGDWMAPRLFTLAGSTLQRDSLKPFPLSQAGGTAWRPADLNGDGPDRSDPG